MSAPGSTSLREDECYLYSYQNRKTLAFSAEYTGSRDKLACTSELVYSAGIMRSMASGSDRINNASMRKGSHPQVTAFSHVEYRL